MVNENIYDFVTSKIVFGRTVSLVRFNSFVKVGTNDILYILYIGMIISLIE